MKPFRSLAVLSALTFFTPLGFAHDDASLDARATPHGGQVRMAGAYHFELVLDKTANAAQDRAVVVYVTDHADQPVDTSGAQGIVTLLEGRRKTSVRLSPDGENRLKGMGRYAAGESLKAVVSVTLAKQPTEQARFTPFAVRTAAAPKTTSGTGPAAHGAHAH